MHLIILRETIENLCKGSIHKRTIKAVLTAILISDPQKINYISPDILKRHTNMALMPGEWRDVIKESKPLLPSNIIWRDHE